MECDLTKEDKARLFENAVRDNLKVLRAFFFSAGLGGHEAADLTQETFLTAFKRLDSFDFKKPFGPWLRGIARMKYLERCREIREIPSGEDLMAAAEEECAFFEENGLAGNELFSALEECLRKIDAGTGDLLKAHYCDLKSCREAAELFSISEVTVRKRLQRARKLLKLCVVKHSEEAL